LKVQHYFIVTEYEIQTSHFESEIGEMLQKKFSDIQSVVVVLGKIYYNSQQTELEFNAFASFLSNEIINGDVVFVPDG
jgi:hypothetical protein